MGRHAPRRRRRALHCGGEAQFRGHCATRGRQRAGGWFAYWLGDDALTPAGTEERVTDRLALAQIWEHLPDEDRRLLLTLAEHDGDYSQAAAALGLARAAYHYQLSRARTRFRQLWHQGETPSAPWGADRRGTGSMPVTYRLKVRRRAATRRAQGQP